MLNLCHLIGGLRDIVIPTYLYLYIYQSLVDTTG